MFELKCMCGCVGEDHEYPGGPCQNCWHCEYIEYGGPYEATNSGQQEYLDNRDRRWFW